MSPPGRENARRTGDRNRAAGTHARPKQTNRQPRHSQDRIPARSIDRAQQLVNLGAVLAMDLAALASRSGRGDYAAAALHLVEATRAAWLASETLAEGVTR